MKFPELPNLPPPPAGQALPMASCSCALLSGQVSAFGWHMEVIGSRGCFVYGKTTPDETGQHKCFRGDCDGTELHCVYEGHQIAVERCPAYMRKLVEAAEAKRTTPIDDGVVD